VPENTFIINTFIKQRIEPVIKVNNKKRNKLLQRYKMPKSEEPECKLND
jgi:hypothetical protein